NLYLSQHETWIQILQDRFHILHSLKNAWRHCKTLSRSEDPPGCNPLQLRHSVLPDHANHPAHDPPLHLRRRCEDNRVDGYLADHGHARGTHNLRDLYPYVAQPWLQRRIKADERQRTYQYLRLGPFIAILLH